MRWMAIAAASIRRVARDRTALFFLLVLPVIVILIVGASVRGFNTFRVGVVDEGAGPAGQTVVASLSRAPAVALHRYPDENAALTAQRRGELDTTVILPRGMQESLQAGQAARVEVIAERTNSTQQAAATTVSDIIGRVGGRVQAAQFATSQVGGSFDRNLSVAARTEPTVASIQTVERQVDSSRTVLPEGFSYSAPTMLVLFVFLSAIAGGASIVETRRMGMYERMAAAPVNPSTIIVGETTTYVAIAAIQALLIVLVAALAFGVSWGNPLAASLLIAIWAVVGAGAGMLSGTLFRTPEQATAIGPAVGITLGMLGGCMWPLAIVGPAMRQIGHLTPHAWAVDAWTDLVSRGGGVGSIAIQLGVLAVFAVGFMSLATWRLRRILT